MTTTGLLTDRYEFTMLEAALADGAADRPATFEAFARDVPEGSAWGVMGGTPRLVEAIGRFRFEPDQLAHLATFVSPAAVAWLEGYRFSGTVDAYPEGELWWAGSPLVTVRGTFGACVLLETLVLSVLNHDSAVASRAAGIALAAAGAGVIEMGSRRTHEAAAVDAARLAWVCGFASTSNVEAGRRYGVPTAGTAAHSWTMVHDEEIDAFRAQITALGVDTTLLVDTYDIPTGIDRAVAAARERGADGPGAVRIDSGDLATEAVKARRRLDDVGASRTRITVSGDLDAAAIAALVEAGAPIDGFGVGTNLVSVPPVGAIYKLVEVGDAGSMRPVAKRSVDKATVGGAKRAWRRPGEVDTVLAATDPGPAGARPVAGTVLDAGTPDPALADPVAATTAARLRFEASVAELTHVRDGAHPPVGR